VVGEEDDGGRKEERISGAGVMTVGVVGLFSGGLLFLDTANSVLLFAGASFVSHGTVFTTRPGGDWNK
jgi:hypothetical protein